MGRQQETRRRCGPVAVGALPGGLPTLDSDVGIVVGMPENWAILRIRIRD